MKCLLQQMPIRDEVLLFLHSLGRLEKYWFVNRIAAIEKADLQMQPGKSHLVPIATCRLVRGY